MEFVAPLTIFPSYLHICNLFTHSLRVFVLDVFKAPIVEAQPNEEHHGEGLSLGSSDAIAAIESVSSDLIQDQLRVEAPAITAVDTSGLWSTV